MKAVNFAQQSASSIAGTSGDGAVTMAALTGYPTLTQALGTTSARIVRYVIQKLSTGASESGIGSVAGGVLTRTLPQITWDGTTYKDGTSAVSALQFGSSPTAGDVVVRITQTAEDRAPVLDARQTAWGAVSSWKAYVVSAHFNSYNGGGGAGLSADTQYDFLHLNTMAGVLKGIQIQIDSAGTAASIKWGLYEIGPDGLRGNLLCTFNNVDASTTGTKTDSSTSTWSVPGGVHVSPGWYVIGVIASVGCSIHCGPGFNGPNIQGPYGVTNAYGSGYMFKSTQTYSAGLATTAATGYSYADNGGGANLNNPWIGWKVVP